MEWTYGEILGESERIVSNMWGLMQVSVYALVFNFLKFSLAVLLCQEKQPVIVLIFAILLFKAVWITHENDLVSFPVPCH